MNAVIRLKEVTKIRQIEVESVLKERYKKGIRTPEDAYGIASPLIGDSDREVFLVLCLNTKNKVNAFHIAHVGSINSSIVHPADVFKSAILFNSASIIVAHNHPSYDPTPSFEDIEMTSRLYRAGQILGIELLDHIIVGGGHFYSIKEKGHFKSW